LADFPGSESPPRSCFDPFSVSLAILNTLVSFVLVCIFVDYVPRLGGMLPCMKLHLATQLLFVARHSCTFLSSPLLRVSFDTVAIATNLACLSSRRAERLLVVVMACLLIALSAVAMAWVFPFEGCISVA
jgi:hypothetical protein